MTFQGKSALVTGGSRGIGRAIALRFAELGAARVGIGYLRNDRAAEETAAALEALGSEPVLVRGNAGSGRMLEQVKALGALDAFVHNAATGVIRPALDVEDKHWDWTLGANARAFLSLTRTVAPAMAPGSSIVAISSLGASVSWRTTSSWGHPRRRSSRSSAIWPSSSRRARSASTRSRPASSRRTRWSTSRIGSGCSPTDWRALLPAAW